MRERALIDRLSAAHLAPEGVIGIGDDCCVWTPAAATCLSVDSVVEGVHFAPDTDPRSVGRKAAGAALSDLAAMGARPVGAVAAIMWGAERPRDEVMDGVGEMLTEHACPLLGGDVTGGDHLAVSITVWGEPGPGGRFVRRGGGRVGDLLVVTGWLGGSSERGRHLAPQPRLAQGQWLANVGGVHALMDLSDGLASDAPRLAEASGCGCVLLPGSVPIHDDLAEVIDQERRACCDGEDYELVFALEPADWPSVASAWPFDHLPLSVVGWLVAEGGCWVEDHNRRLRPLEWAGFEH